MKLATKSRTKSAGFFHTSLFQRAVRVGLLTGVMGRWGAANDKCSQIFQVKHHALYSGSLEGNDAMDTLLNILDRMGGAMLMGAILSGIVYLFLAILKDPLEFLERIFPKVINDVIGNILGLIWGALFIFGLMLFFCSPLLAIQDYFSNNPSRGTTLSEIVLWVYHGFVSYGAGSFWSGVYTVVVSAGTFVGSIAAFVPVLSFCWKKVRGVSNVQKRSEK